MPSNLAEAVLSPSGYTLPPIKRTSHPSAGMTNTIASMSANVVARYQSELARIASYVTIPVGWDYADGQPLTPQARAAAVVLLNRFASENIVPLFSLMNSGGLSVEVARTNVDLMLDIEPTGIVHLYLSASGREYEASGPVTRIAAILDDLFSPVSALR